MRTALLVTLTLIGLAFAAAPAAAAPEDPYCGSVYDCEGVVGIIKREVQEILDDHTGPCTCDPEPTPI